MNNEIKQSDIELFQKDAIWRQMQIYKKEVNDIKKEFENKEMKLERIEELYSALLFKCNDNNLNVPSN